MTDHKKQAQTKKTDSKGHQLSLAEYKALKEREAKKPTGFSLPLAIQLLLALPLIALFLIGLYFIPLMAIRGCDNQPPATTQNK